MHDAAPDFEIVCLQGAQAHACLPSLAALRIEVFRSWPYLYAGNLDYEAGYLRTYSQSQRSVFVLARAHGQIVGCATAIPLVDETPNVQAPFTAVGIDPAGVFYFGESVLQPAWRGRGIGHRFFDAREASARAGGFTMSAFCAVDRALEDPRRPADFLPLDRFWTARGYARQPHMQANMEWQEVGADSPSGHRLTFWTRRL